MFEGLKKGSYYWVKWGSLFVEPLKFDGYCFLINEGSDTQYELYEDDINAISEEIIPPFK